MHKPSVSSEMTESAISESSEEESKMCEKDSFAPLPEVHRECPPYPEECKVSPPSPEDLKDSIVNEPKSSDK